MIRSILVPAVAALMLAAGPARADLINGSYTVAANGNSAIGLAVVTLNDLGSGANPTSTFSSLSIPHGGSIVRDLFTIFPSDATPWSGNDLLPQMISVAFNITSPIGGGTITGTTRAIDDDEGLLHWNGPLTIALSDGTYLTITLFDADLGDFTSVVLAQLQIVPAPGTLALLGIGLLGVAIRRKRVAA